MDLQAFSKQKDIDPYKGYFTTDMISTIKMVSYRRFQGGKGNGQALEAEQNTPLE
jgi:hypothetical protein